MAIGNRIKFFRNKHNLTQKELGAKVGFPFNATDVRIAQYESETRTPKDNIIEKLAEILEVSPSALKIPDIDTNIGLMHTLFALEDIKGLSVNMIDGVLCLTLSKDNSEYLSMFDMLSAWYSMREKFLAGDITQEEYDKWRYTYPKMEAERFKQELDELRSKKKKSK